KRSLYTPKHENVELQSADDIKVRLKNPPPLFDDKGKPKRYTKKELDDLKGPDKKLPGYAADFENLRNDQIVEIQLVKKKDASKPSAGAKEKTKEPKIEAKPVVAMITIIADTAK